VVSASVAGRCARRRSAEEVRAVYAHGPTHNALFVRRGRARIARALGETMTIRLQASATTAIRTPRGTDDARVGGTRGGCTGWASSSGAAAGTARARAKVAPRPGQLTPRRLCASAKLAETELRKAGWRTGTIRARAGRTRFSRRLPCCSGACRARRQAGAAAGVPCAEVAAIVSQGSGSGALWRSDSVDSARGCVCCNDPPLRTHASICAIRAAKRLNMRSSRRWRIVGVERHREFLRPATTCVHGRSRRSDASAHDQIKV